MRLVVGDADNYQPAIAPIPHRHDCPGDQRCERSVGRTPWALDLDVAVLVTLCKQGLEFLLGDHISTLGTAREQVPKPSAQIRGAMTHEAQGRALASNVGTQQRAAARHPPSPRCSWQTSNMAINEAFLAGGFALAGVAMQQAIAMLTERQRFRREQIVRNRAEQHEAFVQLVTSGRRVQRALVDRDERPDLDVTAERLADELDGLTEAAVVVRLIVRDQMLLDAVESFEAHAKRLEAQGHPTSDHLMLSGLIRDPAVRVRLVERGRVRGSGERPASTVRDDVTLRFAAV